MPARTRSRILMNTTNGGFYNLVRRSDGVVWQTIGGTTGNSWYQTCADVTMTPPFNVDHDLAVKYSGFQNPGRLTGISKYNGTYDYHFEGYALQNRTLAVYTPLPSPIGWGYWKTKALANLNPNATVVDLPLFLFELREFPRMLKQLGDVLRRRYKPHDVPGGYLAYSFGWEPLIKDLMSLLNLQKSLDDRIRQIRKMEDGGRFRRSLGEQTMSDSVSPDGWAFTTTQGAIVRADVSVSEVHKVWFTANAKVIDPLPSSAALEDRVFRSLLGLNVSAETLWNAVPWSWLIDYFVNFGDYLEARRGGIRWRCTRLNLMCTITLRQNLVNVRYLDPNMKLEGGNALRIEKHRKPYVNPLAMLAFDPILSGRQMANLGALITAKALKSL